MEMLRAHQRKRIAAAETKVLRLIEKPATQTGRIVGHTLSPLRNYFERIAQTSHFNIDQESRAHLEEIAQSGKPVIITANHQPVDPQLYPRAHYRYNLSVDAFLLEEVCKSMGIDLHFLALFTKSHHHANPLRRLKSYVGDYIRHGLYEAWGFIPVDKTVHSQEIKHYDYVTKTPPTRNPIAVARSIQQYVEQGSSIGFFVQRPENDDTIHPILWPGAAYHAGRLGIDIVPVFINGAVHLDPRHTAAPNEVIVRVGERISPAKPDRSKSLRRRQIEDTMGQVRQQLLHLREQAPVR